ncbi:amidohydrolase [Marinobacterium mangrovicola]|uniref:Carboxypeptidase Ss1 n=1 Tax=Marinobacterium mangrovicola TaxID=1476959 RepID=A0A4R1HGS1_9GAMM|nr:amidohydrolase [Marinobacterium mangrovicola]TCK16402.1 carboxypeptidase Ss1 [Marinobacterium mangrovicola]
MIPTLKRALLTSALSSTFLVAQSQAAVDAIHVDTLIRNVMPQVIDWRRDIHQHPELGNREFRTAEKVANHLKGLGIEVETGVAHTGVVGILRGAKEGPVVALRADMDALPVTEDTGLPFASKVTTTFAGKEVGVAHACGHDAHTAILMGVAEVLAELKNELNGTVMFIFQPAEEGAPPGEEGGAKLMLEEGLFAELTPDAVFGLHVMPSPVGTIEVRERGILASSDGFEISVNGKQTHGAMPWLGIDPVTLSGQIITGLQTIPSRQLDFTNSASLITVGKIEGGVRANIIPNNVKMEGIVRTLDPETQTTIHEYMERTVHNIAESGGGSADLTITPYYPVTYNNPELTRQMTPSLSEVAEVNEAKPLTGSEDFSFYAEQVPGMFFFLGAAPDQPDQVFPNHSPKFVVNEKALPIGVSAMTKVTLDFLSNN